MSDKEVRIPKQARSIEKKNIIKKAALELFTEKGYHQTTSNEIAKRANLSIGTFYSYFPDKKGVYEELVKEFYQYVIKQVPQIDVSTDHSIFEIAKSIIYIVVQEHTYMTEFQKEIFCLSKQSEELKAIDDKYRINVNMKIIELISDYKEAIRITDFKTASMVIMNSLEAVVHDMMFYSNDYDNDAVVSELADMLCRYIFKPEYLK